MWTFASVCFLLTVLRIDADSCWYSGYDKLECRDDGACQCKDTSDNDNVFLDWTVNIESCTCFMNKDAYENNPTLVGCVPKCRSNGWYDVEQLCDGKYFCADKNGETILGTETDDANKLDCSAFAAADDNGVSDAVGSLPTSSEDNDQSSENNSDETEPGDNVDSESDGGDSGDSEDANNEQSTADESNDSNDANNEEPAADETNDSSDANNEEPAADETNDSSDANNEESTADETNDSSEANNEESTADETNDSSDANNEESTADETKDGAAEIVGKVQNIFG